MEKFDLYKDIASRTSGDIYIGVVGPVRTGKSTFIRKFMDTFVLENITDQNKRLRAVDEMPQSADGKTIMTTQPKFVPAESVEILLDQSIRLNVRLIDCVGYLADGAIGHTENGKERSVITPWSSQGMPFEAAAEMGTRKVIMEHSTIGIVVTTDGSITELPRDSYLVPEERVISELKALGKPFLVLLNSKDPTAPSAIALKDVLEQRYDVPVVLKNVNDLEKEDINSILDTILKEFPVKIIDADIPKWMRSLDRDNKIIKDVLVRLELASTRIIKMKDYEDGIVTAFDDSEFFDGVGNALIDMGKGQITIPVIPKADLFYKMLTEIAGEDISDEFIMMQLIRRLKAHDKEYTRLQKALQDVENFGYGVVVPQAEQLTLEEPAIVKQGGRFGVKLRASAPSLHIMRVDVEAEVSPAIGAEQQNEEMIKYMLEEFENDKQGIWNTNMFGKSLNMMVREGLNNKLYAMPEEVRNKMRRTLSRIVNEGKGGVMCILL